MSDTKRLVPAALLALGGVASSVDAQESSWDFEITPYVWAAGIDADVTVGGRTVEVDKSFSDVLDAVDFGGSALAVAHINRFVVWTQLDYLALDTDELDKTPARGQLETDMFVGTLGFGYQFGQPGARTVDLLLGARYLSLENTLTLDGIGVFKRDKDFTDPVLILRPSWPLGERWRFNPTISYGTGGDSESTYEVQPQFQFQINDSLAARFGYRRLFYDIESENGLNNWDGSFQGLFVGLGGTFGAGPNR